MEGYRSFHTGEVHVRHFQAYRKRDAGASQATRRLGTNLGEGVRSFGLERLDFRIEGLGRLDQNDGELLGLQSVLLERNLDIGLRLVRLHAPLDWSLHRMPNCNEDHMLIRATDDHYRGMLRGQ